MAVEADVSIGCVTEADLERLSIRATLTENVFDSAVKYWREIRDAILSGVRLEGLSSITASKVRKKYLSIKRLTDEARKITLLESAPDDIQIVYAIDPHLISGYCRYWKDRFASFDFVATEWRRTEGKERKEFIVFLLGAILRMRELICLEAGRQEIADMLAYFIDEQVEAEEKTPDVQMFEEALTVLLNESGPGANHDQRQASKAIWERFEALVGAGGIPLMQQSLAVARLAGVLRSGRLRASFAALRSKLEKEGAEQLERLRRAEALFRAFQANQDRTREARSRLYEAYLAFADVSNLGSADFIVSQESAKLRPGEYSNIDALFEMHLLNICLSDADVKARVHYITDSPVMYNFVHALSRNEFNVELVHPRHVFVFENQPTAENFARYQQILVGPNAFAHAVPKDGSIKLSELQRFESTFKGLLRDVRATYSFAQVDSADSREATARVINNFAARFGSDAVLAKLAEVTGRLNRISDKLEETSGTVEQLFIETADMRSSQSFAAYKKFVEEMPARNRANMVLVRVFGEDGGGVTPRVVCIPVSGGYRNLFKIYDPEIVRRVRAEAGGIVQLNSITDLLGLVEDSAPGAKKRPLAEAEALVEFARAAYAAADREWLLSISFTQSGLRLLGLDSQTMGDDPWPQARGGTEEARRRFLIQEAALLQHFSRRGVAANLETLARRQRRMRMAANDLRLSAFATQSIDDANSYDTEFEPNSVRQALAAMALIIEWLVLRETRTASGRAVKPAELSTKILPPAVGPHIVWHGLTVANMTLDDYWNDPESIGVLAHDLTILAQRVEMIYSRLKLGDGSGHSAEFWRYINIRTLSLRALLSVLQSLEMLPGDPTRYRPVEIRYLRDLLGAHTRFIAAHAAASDTPSGDSDRFHPFASFLIDTLEFLSAREREDSGFDETTERSRAFFAISGHHNSLSQNGFPRLVSQTFISRYGAEVAGKLKRYVETLERESRPGYTPFADRKPNATAIP